jgi:lincosamide nucleotidyltransferase A/C/D/E
VLGDKSGHEIDVHVIVLDEQGNGIYGRPENEMYPAAALTGNGTINDRAVRCISPEWAIKFHSGYELKEKDYNDVAALCERFGIPLPDDYKQFEQKLTSGG